MLKEEEGKQSALHVGYGNSKKELRKENSQKNMEQDTTRGQSSMKGQEWCKERTRGTRKTSERCWRNGEDGVTLRDEGASEEQEGQ